MKHKKYILILIVLTLILNAVPSVYASKLHPEERCNARVKPTNEPCVQDYVLLAPLPCENATKDGPGCINGQLENFAPSQSNSFGAYLNFMIKLFIGICAVMSVVMIVMGGIEYMTSELVHTKESGKEKIEHAILGLIIALGAYALLFTINPDLLKSDFDIPIASVVIQEGYCDIGDYDNEADCEEGGGTWIFYRGECVVRETYTTGPHPFLDNTYINTKAGCEAYVNAKKESRTLMSWTPNK